MRVFSVIFLWRCRLELEVKSAKKLKYVDSKKALDAR